MNQLQSFFPIYFAYPRIIFPSDRTLSMCSLLGQLINRDTSVDEVYDGPAAPVWTAVAQKAMPSKGNGLSHSSNCVN